MRRIRLHLSRRERERAFVASMVGHLMTSVMVATSILGLAVVMSPIANLKAAELKVIAGGSMTASLNELGPQFERASGHKLVIHFDSTPNIIARVTSGTPFDLAVVPVDVFQDTAAKARFVSGPTIDIARVGYGVIVRAGAAKPDISTPDVRKADIVIELPDVLQAIALHSVQRVGTGPVERGSLRRAGESRTRASRRRRSGRR